MSSNAFTFVSIKNRVLMKIDCPINRSINQLKWFENNIFTDLKRRTGLFEPIFVH
jgi:hypothetical protein